MAQDVDLKVIGSESLDLVWLRIWTLKVVGSESVDLVWLRIWTLK